MTSDTRTVIRFPCWLFFFFEFPAGFSQRQRGMVAFLLPELHYIA